MPEYRSLLETTENTRDLGGHLCQNGAVTNYRVFLRSDLQTAPSERDCRFLMDNHITTIIDMRDSAAVRQAKSGFDGKAGFSYHLCPIEALAGPPGESLENLHHEYYAVANSAEAAGILKLMADAPGGCMFNCLFGKDRTGIMTAILLKLAGVSNEDIIADYMLTLHYCTKAYEEMCRAFPDLNMEEHFLPKRRYIEGFLQLMDAEYASAAEYLSRIGLSDQQIRTLYTKLVSK